MNALWLQRGCAGFHNVEGFISERIFGFPKQMPGETIMAVMDGASLLGAVIFQNYNADAGVIEMSAAAVSGRWLSRPILLEMHSYPFQQLGCQAVIMRCSADDKRMDRIRAAYGFKRYEIPRLRGRNEAEAIFVLSDEDWRTNGFHKELTNG